MKILTLLLTLLSLGCLASGCNLGSGAPLPDIDPSTATLQAEAITPGILPSRPAPSSIAEPLTTATAMIMKCTPTLDDGVSPSYEPDTPLRSSVGSGHVLSGVVRSSRACAPIANAQLELWPEYAREGHPDEARATIYTDSLGRYRFECDLPEHIHMRISATGYRTIGQNSYHPEGLPEGTFDVVLEPESPN